MIERLPTPCVPRQYEFARLNLTYTVMSKRALIRLVQEGHVAGWDDPRMPTLCGMRRRGVPPEAVRDFIGRIGVAKAGNLVDVAMLEHCIRDRLNKRAPRRMGVLDPLKVVIENYPAGEEEALEAINNPEDREAGVRAVPFGREIFIERDDFMEEPPRKFFRLAPGREVRLRYAYFVTCTGVVRDASGEVVELRCRYDPETRGGNAPDGRKVKGTLHWVSAALRRARRGSPLRPPVRQARHERARRLHRRPEPGLRYRPEGLPRRAGGPEHGGGRRRPVRAPRLLLRRPGYDERQPGLQSHDRAAGHLGEDPARGGPARTGRERPVDGIAFRGHTGGDADEGGDGGMAGKALDGKVALVTGAGRGIGREIALAMAARGAAVAVNDTGGSVDGRGARPGARVRGRRGDRRGRRTRRRRYGSVADFAAAERMVADAVDAFGRIDIVVNNAGIVRDAIFHKMTEEDWDAVVDVHLKGTFNVSRAAASRFREQESGCFVHMTSTSGLVGNLGQAGYGAAKLGIAGLSRIIAIDMERFGVRSNAIAPFAWSRITDTIPASDAAQADRIEKLKRMAPSMIAPLAVYLASDAARGVTGQIFGCRRKRDLPVQPASPRARGPSKRGMDARDHRRARDARLASGSVSAAPRARRFSAGIRCSGPAAGFQGGDLEHWTTTR